MPEGERGIPRQLGLSSLVGLLVDEGRDRDGDPLLPWLDLSAGIGPSPPRHPWLDGRDKPIAVGVGGPGVDGSGDATLINRGPRSGFW